MTEKWYSIKLATKDLTEVYLYEDIGEYGISAQQFAIDLGSIKTPKVLLRINSGGGDVFDGTAIYQAIREHASEVNAIVDGVAASMATLIALACKKVSMSKNARFMIHNPWSIVAGDAKELRKKADELDSIGTDAAAIYSARMKITPEKCLAMMDEETWFTSQQAKDAGLVDEIVDGKEVVSASAMQSLMRFKNVPEDLKQIAAKLLQKATAADEQKARDMEAAKAETARIKREIEMDEQAALA